MANGQKFSGAFEGAVVFMLTRNGDVYQLVDGEFSGGELTKIMGKKRSCVTDALDTFGITDGDASNQ